MVNLGDLGLLYGNPGDMFEVVDACRSKDIQVEEGSTHFRSSNEGLPSLKLTIRPTWAGSQKEISCSNHQFSRANCSFQAAYLGYHTKL